MALERQKALQDGAKRLTVNTVLKSKIAYVIIVSINESPIIQ